YILMTIKKRQILSPSPLIPIGPSIAIHNLYEQQLSEQSEFIFKFSNALKKKSDLVFDTARASDRKTIIPLS
ncbi:hypothetical protein, partial [Tychonema sp. LEGE 06208]|uniref:hypothetical protein n=1 Tax=Tychonema sp. LEGE 06208 TaxID=1828663 RepID=UPI001D1552E3